MAPHALQVALICQDCRLLALMSHYRQLRRLACEVVRLRLYRGEICLRTIIMKMECHQCDQGCNVQH